MRTNYLRWAGLLQERRVKPVWAVDRILTLVSTRPFNDAEMQHMLKGRVLRLLAQAFAEKLEPEVDIQIRNTPEEMEVAAACYPLTERELIDLLDAAYARGRLDTPPMPIIYEGKQP